MKVLVINAGSSSLKYQLLDPDTKEVLAKGLCERIGLDGNIKPQVPPPARTFTTPTVYMPDHEAAIKLVWTVLTHNYYGVIKDMSEIDAVGHRVVHGGEKFTPPWSSTGTWSWASRSAAPWPHPQSRQHHRHPGLSDPHARRPHGRRVRHRLPSDHAAQGLHLRGALPLVLPRRTRSAATASMVPPTAMYPSVPLRFWAAPSRS